MEQEAQRPFDLAAAPPLRALLLHLGTETLGAAAPAVSETPGAAAPASVLLLNMHHAVVDGWSLEVLARELAVLYAAGATGTNQRMGRDPFLRRRGHSVTTFLIAPTEAIV